MKAARRDGNVTPPSRARGRLALGRAGGRSTGNGSGRGGRWSWLHATACSAAIVASGAYMHAALTSYLDALASATRDPPLMSPAVANDEDESATTDGQVPSQSALGAGTTSISLAWRWVLVTLGLVLWALGLLLLRRLGLHRSLRRLLGAIVDGLEAVRRRIQRYHGRRCGPGASGSAKHRRRLSTDGLPIDEDDLLIVTSLSVERRLRRTSSSTTSAAVGVRGPSLSATTAWGGTDLDDPGAADAQILLHPRDGARGGRHQSNHIIVDDPYVSRYHFAIEYDALEKEYYLQDLGSTTGTFLFLKPNVAKRLVVDERIRLGDSEFEVVAIDENAATGTPFLRITFTEGPLRGVGQTIGRSAVTLGRRSCNALCITEDNSISGRHCVISYLGDGFYLTDLHSTNGTAMRLSPSGQPSPRRYLLHGDVFGVGANRFLVEYAHELQIQEQQLHKHHEEQER